MKIFALFFVFASSQVLADTRPAAGTLTEPCPQGQGQDQSAPHADKEVSNVVSKLFTAPVSLIYPEETTTEGTKIHDGLANITTVLTKLGCSQPNDLQVDAPKEFKAQTFQKFWKASITATALCTKKLKIDAKVSDYGFSTTSYQFAVTNLETKQVTLYNFKDKVLQP